MHNETGICINIILIVPICADQTIRSHRRFVDWINWSRNVTQVNVYILSFIQELKRQSLDSGAQFDVFSIGSTFCQVFQKNKILELESWAGFIIRFNMQLVRFLLKLQNDSKQIKIYFFQKTLTFDSFGSNPSTPSFTQYSFLTLRSLFDFCIQTFHLPRIPADFRKTFLQITKKRTLRKRITVRRNKHKFKFIISRVNLCVYYL